MKTLVYPYKQSSTSAKLLAEGLGIKRIKIKNSSVKDNGKYKIINWGSSSHPYKNNNVINKDTSIASDKLVLFKSMGRAMPVPKHTTSIRTASKWILEGHKVCCRTTLNGNSGKGLIIASTKEELVDAPLYTKYEEKTQEYRIHCYKDKQGECKAFWRQRKGKRRGVEANPLIRNHDNGYVFVIQDVNPPESVYQAALAVFKKSGLDFGAMDVGHNEHTDKAFVYEINTAPGIEGTTLQKYVEMFKEIL